MAGVSSMSVNDGGMGFPVALESDKDLRSFLKDIDIPGACIVGAANVMHAGGDSWKFLSPALHYTLPHSVHTLGLPEPQGKGKGMERVDMQGPRLALLKGASQKDGRSSRTGQAASSGSPVIDAFLRDIPALQGFLSRFLGDPNMLPTTVSLRRPRPSVAEQLKNHDYVLEVDQGGQGIRLHVLRRTAAKPPRRPSSSSSPQQRSHRQHQSSFASPAASFLSDPAAAAPPEPAALVYDTFMVRPTYNKGRALVCVLSFSKTEPPEHRKRVRRKRDVMSLASSVADVVTLARMAVDDIDPRNTAVHCLLSCLGLDFLTGRSARRSDKLSSLMATSSLGSPSDDDPALIQATDGSGFAMTVRGAPSDTSMGGERSVAGNSEQGSPSSAFTLRQHQLTSHHMMGTRRLLETRAFCRSLWRAARAESSASGPPGLMSPSSETLMLRCLLMPSECKLLNAIVCGRPAIEAQLLVDEVQLALGQDNRTTGGGLLRASEHLSTLCETMWELLEADGVDEKVVSISRRLVKHLPAVLDSCLKRQGVQRAVAVYRSVMGPDGGHNTLESRLSNLSRRFILPGEADAVGVNQHDERAVLSLLEFVADFELAEERREELEIEGTDVEVVTDRESSADTWEKVYTARVDQDDSGSRHSLHSQHSPPATRRSEDAGDKGSTAGSYRSQSGSLASTGGLRLKAKRTFSLHRPLLRRNSSFTHKSSAKVLATSTLTELKIDMPPSGRKVSEPITTRTSGTTSRSAVSDETELATAEPGSAGESASSRTRAATQIVPKLVINHREASTSEATGGRSTGATARGVSSTTAVASPYTTRSSRRYNANRQSTNSVPQRLRTMSSFLLPPQARSFSMTTSQILADSVKSAMTRTLANTDDLTEATLPKLVSLARNLGQSYLASDLWAIMEMQREHGASLLQSSGAMVHLPSTVEEGAVFPLGYRSQGSVDMRRCSVLDPAVQLWESRSKECLLYWKEGYDIVQQARPLSVARSHTKPSFESAVAVLKLVRDLVKLSPSGVMGMTTEEMDHLGDLVVDDLLQRGAAHNTNLGGAGRAHAGLVDEICDMLSESYTVSPGRLDGSVTVTSCTDPVIRCIDRRLGGLRSLHDHASLLLGRERPSGPALVRARLVWIQRCIATDRLRLVRLMFAYAYKAACRNKLSMGVMQSTFWAATNGLAALHIGSKVPTSCGLPPAVGMEDAGLAYWILCALDVVFDRCSRSPSASLKLIEDMHTSSNYVDTLKDCLRVVVFGLRSDVTPDLEKTIKAVIGNVEQTSTFCTSNALTRIRLAIVSHFNRCLDLCRTTLRHFRRDQDFCAKGLDERRGGLRSVILLFQRLNIFINLDSQQVSAIVTMTSFEELDSSRSSAQHDRRTAIAVLWVLSKVVAMEDQGQMQHREWVDRVVFYHFTSFLKLYAQDQRDREVNLMCKLHLRILLSLASSRSPSILARFFQLRVVPFFVHEISAEMQTRSKTAGASHESTMSATATSLRGKKLPQKPLVPAFVTPEPRMSGEGVDEEQKPATPPPFVLPMPSEAMRSPLHRSAPAEVKALPAPTTPVFNESDRVDGLVMLKSGKQRWFPGCIKQAEPGGTYTVMYDDGDVQAGKIGDELRASRSKKRVDGDVARPAKKTMLAGPLRLPALSSRITGPSDASATSSNVAAAVVGAGFLRSASADGARTTGVQSTGATGAGETKTPAFAGLRISIPVRQRSPPADPQDMDAYPETPNAVMSPSDSMVVRQIGTVVSALESAEDVQSDEERDHDEMEDSAVFDIIPAALKPAVKPVGSFMMKPFSSMPAMKLALPEAGLRVSGVDAGGLNSSLSASLLSYDPAGDALDSSRIITPLIRNLSSDEQLDALQDTVESNISELSPRLKLGLGTHATAQGSGLAAAAATAAVQEDAYLVERQKIALYADKQLQELVLLLLLNLCVSADRLRLDTRYCAALPSSQSLDTTSQNLLYALYCHLNHPLNASVLPLLHCHVHQFGKSVTRLFRLLCDKVFDARLYSGPAEILASGAFGTVLKLQSPIAVAAGSASGAEALTVKWISHETSEHDRCATFDVFSEVSALEMLSTSPHVCHLYDYGVASGKFWLIMERCRCSLKTWRLEQMPAAPSDRDTVVYLCVFARVLEAVQTLHDSSIAHFDIKCDNILIRDGPVEKSRRMSSAGKMSPMTSDPGFTVCIGDFGEAQIQQSRAGDAEEVDDDDDDDANSNDRKRVLQARGTEAVQSPEMLQIVAKTRPDAVNYDRRKRVAVGCSSDVWSLGCLLYELITGEFLFNNTDWSQFFVQLTAPSFPLPPPDRMAPLRQHLSPEVYSMVERLLEYMLVRDAERRPRVDHVRRQLQLVLQAISRRNTTSKGGPAGVDGGKGEDSATRRGSDCGVDARRASSVVIPCSGSSEAGDRAERADSPPARPDMWGPLQDDPPSNGLWRLSPDAYMGYITDTASLFHCPLRLSDVMSEEGGLQGEINDLAELKSQIEDSISEENSNNVTRTQPSPTASSPPALPSGEEPDLTFNAGHLPDLWIERPWMDVQRVASNQLGISRLAFFVAWPERKGPSIVATEMELRDVQSVLETGRGRGRASGRRSQGSVGGAFPPSRMPCLVVQLHGPTAASMSTLAATLLESGASLAEKVLDFLLGHDHRGRGVLAMVTIDEQQQSEPTRPSPGSVTNVLATAIACLCTMRSSDVPMSLMEAIVRVKWAYPRACLNPGVVKYLHMLSTRRRNSTSTHSPRAASGAAHVPLSSATG